MYKKIQRAKIVLRYQLELSGRVEKVVMMMSSKIEYSILIGWRLKLICLFAFVWMRAQNNIDDLKRKSNSRYGKQMALAGVAKRKWAETALVFDDAMFDFFHNCRQQLYGSQKCWFPSGYHLDLAMWQ